MSWLIAIPVWGEDYIRTFANATAPALKAAIAKLKRDVRFIVYTDNINRIQQILCDYDVTCRPVAPNAKYEAFHQAHRSALASARMGERVMLTNADSVVSGNLLARCEQHFSTGKKCIVVSGMRTRLQMPVPIGAEPRALLAWSLQHRHKLMSDIDWGSGRCKNLSSLFFHRDGSIVYRAFHLHPLVLIKERELSFAGTIDRDLLNNFELADLHVVTDPDDMAVIELSPDSKKFPEFPYPFQIRHVVEWAKHSTNRMHRNLFKFRIVVQGDDRNCGDIAVCNQILQDLR